MEKGKLIVIEGTDCSGKETQSKKLIEKLNSEGLNTTYYSFPKYDTPSGRIVGLSYLGKPYLAEELIAMHTKEIKERLKIIYGDAYRDDIVDEVLKATSLELACGWFKEGAPNVDPKISSLYYAADRGYNIGTINSILETGTNIILDRYVYSNMAHQGGKIVNTDERHQMFNWIDNLEFQMLSLPHSDIRIFLHMPTAYANLLKAGRAELLDENERDINHLINAEKAFLEVTQNYDFHTIECIKSPSALEPTFSDIKTPDAIGEEVYDVVKKQLKL